MRAKSKHSFKDNIRSISCIYESNGSYFAVRDPTEEQQYELTKQLIQQVVDTTEQKHEAAIRRANLVQASTSLVTKTPWLRHTNWEETFLGYDMAELNMLAKRPLPQDGHEHSIWVAIAKMLKRCWDGFHDIRARGWNMIPFWLASVDRLKENSKPFRKDFPQYTLDRYFGYWQQYIMFCLRISQLNPTLDIIQFTARQQECLRTVLEWMEVGTAEEIEEVYDALLELSVALIMHSDYCKARSSLIRFTGVLGYSMEYKQWRKPQDYTTQLAGLQFCIRIIMLHSALPPAGRDTFYENSTVTPVDIFCNIRKQWLIDGEGIYYNYIANYRYTIWIYSSTFELWTPKC